MFVLQQPVRCVVSALRMSSVVGLVIDMFALFVALRFENDKIRFLIWCNIHFTKLFTDQPLCMRQMLQLFSITDSGFVHENAEAILVHRSNVFLFHCSFYFYNRDDNYITVHPYYSVLWCRPLKSFLLGCPSKLMCKKMSLGLAERIWKAAESVCLIDFLLNCQALRIESCLLSRGLAVVLQLVTDAQNHLACSFFFLLYSEYNFYFFILDY